MHKLVILILLLLFSNLGFAKNKTVYQLLAGEFKPYTSAEIENGDIDRILVRGK